MILNYGKTFKLGDMKMKSEIKTMIGCIVAMSFCTGVIFLIDKNFSEHLYLIYMAFGFPLVVGIVVGGIFIIYKIIKNYHKGVIR